MEYSKYIVIPEDYLKSLLEISMKLYKIGAFNDNFKMRINGEFKENISIFDYVLSNDSKLEYINEFVKLLVEAKIDPNIILSNEIKELVIKFNKSKEMFTKKSPIDIRKNKWIM